MTRFLGMPGGEAYGPVSAAPDTAEARRALTVTRRDAGGEELQKTANKRVEVYVKIGPSL